MFVRVSCGGSASDAAAPPRNDEGVPATGTLGFANKPSPSYWGKSSNMARPCVTQQLHTKWGGFGKNHLVEICLKKTKLNSGKRKI